jgi:uncharacterized protein YfaS (alpha-2-macroglobulin family)
VVIHNYSGAAGSATITAKATGARLSRSSRTVHLSDGGSKRIRFTATARKTNNAKFQFAVQLGEHRDELAVTIPINRALTIDTVTLAKGELSGDNKSVEIPIEWTDNLDLAASELVVAVDRVGMSELEPALRYLIQYPYGCLEQTLSRFIPLTKVRDMAKSLSLTSLRGAKLETFVRAGVAKVLRHQQATGHFSLWPGSKAYPHLTVYALYGLLEAKRSGVRVDQHAIDQATKAMRTWANASKLTSDYENATVAMAAYVLAELDQADSGLNARLYESRSALPSYGKAFLMMALHRSNGEADHIDALKSSLLSQLDRDGDAVVVKESAAGGAHYMSSNTRSTAIALQALLMVDPKHELVPAMARGLQNQQRPNGAWRNTQDNLFGLVALADFARARSAGRSKIKLALDGKRLQRATLTGGKVMSYRKSLRKLRKGTLEVASTGNAVYSVRLVRAKHDRADTGHDNGFSVTRTYTDFEKGDEVTDLRAGQLVKVRVVVKPGGRRNYVAVTDHLPAGLEVVNQKLATSSNHGARNANRRSRWSRNRWDHIDYRDDRVSGFTDYMDSELVLEYTARATLPGSFTALPATAEAMYEPDINGRSAARSVKVSRR